MIAEFSAISAKSFRLLADLKFRNETNAHATINYQTHEFQEGVSILDALRSLKIEVPTLCHDDRLKPCGSCRLCLVDVQGSSHPIAACNTPLADGMVIESHSPELETPLVGLCCKPLSRPLSRWVCWRP
ncbi:MAG: 2Fe-2S iron-sulfur cluster-binding protein [Blastocatellia bacterium]